MFSKHELELALRKTAGTGDLSECRNLIEVKQVDIDAAGGRFNRTALHWAAQNNHVEVVRYLTQKGAKSQYDNTGKLPYALTTTPEIRRFLNYEGHGEAPDYEVNLTTDDLVKYGYDYPKDEIKAKVFRLKSASELQQVMSYYGLRPNSYVHGASLLELIFINRNHYTALLHHLLKSGANPNHKAHAVEHDYYEGTPLHSILANELSERATLFVEKASDPSISKTIFDSTLQDIEGKTILLLGAMLRDASFVKLCLERFGTAAIDLQDNLGRTPLHYAYLFGHQELVSILCDYGANPTITDCDHRVPHDMLTAPVEMMDRAFLRLHIDPNRANSFSCDACLRMKDMSVGFEQKYAAGPTLRETCIQNRQSLMSIKTEEQSLLVIG